MVPQPPQNQYQPPVTTTVKTSYQDLLGRLDTLYSEQPGSSNSSRDRDSAGHALHVLQPGQAHHEQAGQAQQQQGDNSEHSE